MRKLFVLLLTSVFVVAGCGGDDDDGGAAGPVGTLEVSGTYDGAINEGATLQIAVFECPFTMPPKMTGVGTVDAATGETFGTLGGIDVGDWCFMAFIDQDPDDGLAPVVGIDPSSIPSDEAGGEPITIVEGETTSKTVTYQIYAE